MRTLGKLLILVTLAAIAVCPAAAKEKSHARRVTSHQLTKKDRRLIVAAALDSRASREDTGDCSHLVHEIYGAAGFPYTYAPSNDLYAGVGSFQRVKKPLPGDLVVWRGHVGIVIKPSKHSFFSYVSSGPGTENYKSAYWKHRGAARFYRYVKKIADAK